MASDLRVSRHQAKMLKQYVDDIEKMFEELALDDDLDNYLSDERMDRHYCVRYITEELNRKGSE